MHRPELPDKIRFMINLAIVGLGTWGQRHLRSARTSGRFDINIAVDPVAERAGLVADENGLELRASLDEVLSDPAVDAISLATPHTLHTDQIVAAAAAGKHVYTEKPFALNASDARRAVVAAEEAGIIVGLGHDQRHYPVIIRLKEMIDGGDFGKVLTVETTLSHLSLLQPYRDLFAGEGETYARGWRLSDAEAPAGPISQFGLHRIDIFIHLLGEIEWVFAAGSNKAISPSFTDTVSATFGFRNGVTGTLGNSLATPLYNRLQVFGTDIWAESTGPETFEEYRECSLVDLVVFSGEDTDFQGFEIVDSVEKNFGSFADAIEGKAPFIIPLSQMVNTIEVVDALQKSLETGQRVTVGGA